VISSTKDGEEEVVGAAVVEVEVVEVEVVEVEAVEAVFGVFVEVLAFALLLFVAVEVPFGELPVGLRMVPDPSDEIEAFGLKLPPINAHPLVNKWAEG
jgi:hypothetical protein